MKTAINFPCSNQKHKILAHHKEKPSHMLSGWVVHLYYPCIIAVIIDFLLLPQKEPCRLYKNGGIQNYSSSVDSRDATSFRLYLTFSTINLVWTVTLIYYLTECLHWGRLLLILHIEKWIPTHKPEVRKQSTMEGLLDKVLDYYPTQKTVKCVHFPEVQKKEDSRFSIDPRVLPRNN